MRIVLFIIRIILVLVSLGFFGLFVGPMFMNIVNVGNITGAALSLWVFCVSLKPLHDVIKSTFSANMFLKTVYFAVNFGFIALAVYGTLITGAMVFAASQKPVENSTAVVLGAQVKPWGPSVMLRGRINCAEEFLNENPNSYAVLSGGQGSDEIMSEAECMYQTMQEDGIDTSRLYKEDKSTNTTENIKFSMKIIDENNLSDNLAVATDGFHQLRVRIIAKQLGLKGNVGAVNSDTNFLFLPTYAVREWFALPYQVLFR